jgi:hypothetical protein
VLEIKQHTAVCLTHAPTIQHMLAAIAQKFRMNAGAGGRNRTGTGVTPRDFESTRDLSTGAACSLKIGAWHLRFSAAFSVWAKFDAPMIWRTAFNFVARVLYRSAIHHR